MRIAREESKLRMVMGKLSSSSSSNISSSVVVAAVIRITFSCLILLACFSPTRISGASVVGLLTTTPVYGTTSGYDAGGTEPVCWETRMIKKADHENLTTTTTLENTSRTGTVNLPFDDDNNDRNNNQVNSTSTTNETNNLMMDVYDNDEEIAKLLPRCYNGTRLSVTPVNLTNDVMYTGQSYTFRLDLQVIFSAIDERIQNEQNESTVMFHLRLQLCDAVRQGFCNPLRNTNELDASIRPIDSDLGASEGDTFPEDTNRWHYSERNALLGLEYGDGSIIFSRWIRCVLVKSPNDADFFGTSINVTLQLLPGTRQTAYFFLGHAVLDFELSGGHNGDEKKKLLRVDVAEAIPDNVVDVKNPPRVLALGNVVKVWVAIASCMVGLLALCMLCFIIQHRNHDVMMLAQGSFLAAMTAACLIKMAFTYTLLPTQNLHCKLSGPLIGIPSTFIAAVLAGRIWRIHATLSTANGLGKGKNSGVLSIGNSLSRLLGKLAQILLCLCCRKKPARPNAGLRRAVSTEETASLIAVLTLPQMLFQAYVWFLVEKKLQRQYNTTETVCRVACDADNDWTEVVSSSITASVYLLAVVLAYISRNLMSAFNEKDQIFQVSVICSMLSFISMVTYQLTNDPTTSPDVFVFVRSAQSVGVVGSVLMLIVCPKIHRVWSGEKVVLSSLLGSKKFTAPQSGVASSSSTPTTPNFFHDSNSTVASGGSSARNHSEVKGIEEQLYSLQNAIQALVSKCADGRRLPPEDLEKLRLSISSLSEDLHAANT